MDMLELLKTKIVIHANADLTPSGRRTFRIVRHTFGKKCAPCLRWYVAGTTNRTLELSDSAVKLSKEWVAARSNARAAA